MQWSDVKSTAELVGRLVVAMGQAGFLLVMALIEVVKFVFMVLYVLALNNAPGMVELSPIKVSEEMLAQYTSASAAQVGFP